MLTTGYVFSCSLMHFGLLKTSQIAVIGFGERHMPKCWIVVHSLQHVVLQRFGDNQK